MDFVNSASGPLSVTEGLLLVTQQFTLDSDSNQDLLYTDISYWRKKPSEGNSSLNEMQFAQTPAPKGIKFMYLYQVASGCFSSVFGL